MVSSLPRQRIKDRHMMRVAIARSQLQEFEIEGVKLRKVPTFRYLGGVLSETNSDWPTLYRNLQRSKVKWAMISRVPTQAGATVLLYGCESWVVTDRMLAVLTSSHHRVARRIAKRQAVLQEDGEWVYPDIGEAREAAGLLQKLMTSQQLL